MAISVFDRGRVIATAANLIRQRQGTMRTLAGPATVGAAAVGIAGQVRALHSRMAGLTGPILNGAIRAAANAVRAAERMRANTALRLGDSDIPVAATMHTTQDKYLYYVVYSTVDQYGARETKTATVTNNARMSADEIEAFVTANNTVIGSRYSGTGAPLGGLGVGAYVTDVMVLHATRQR